MKIRQVVFGTMLALVGGVAGAGLYQPSPLTIDFDNQVATGDMHSARLSDNPAAFIGCGIRSPVPGYTFAFCQAQLAEDGLVQCVTDDAAYIATVGAMDDFSYIAFTWDADGNCTSVGNSTQSFYLPDFVKTDKQK